MGKMVMADKFIPLTVTFILFAFSTLTLLNLPYYIVGTNYELLVWILWMVGFSVAFVKIAMD